MPSEPEVKPQLKKASAVSEMDELLQKGVNDIWSTYDVDKMGSLDKDQTRKFIKEALKEMAATKEQQDAFDGELFDKTYSQCGLHTKEGRIAREDMVSFIKKLTGLEGHAAQSEVVQIAANLSAIVKQIEREKVLVYSKTYCKYSAQAKDLLQEKGVAFTVVELDIVPNGALIQNTLKEITKQATVPNIFIASKNIGGYSDLKAYEASGELKKMLDDAGVSNSF